MCRILVARFSQVTDPHPALEAFANMSQASKSLDGDWQGDGWGVAWLDETNQWQYYRSLSPIWEDRSAFGQVPPTRSLVTHARSASFPHQKGVLEYNQPYVTGPYAFVFNGLIRGVNLPPIPGQIGAQKIWHLLQQELVLHDPDTALRHLADYLQTHCKEIAALNIGLATPTGIYGLNEFSRHPEYYTLHHWQSDQGEFICSEPLTL